MTITTEVQPSSMNHQRAAWADAAVLTFMHETGTDVEDVLGDLLCDLMHWAAREGHDFQLVLARAVGHFTIEVVEDTQALDR